jgi:hypothetical protein
MKKVKCSVEGELGVLNNQLYASKMEIEWLIKETPYIKGPESLHEAERRIGEATNRLATRISALKTQESLNKDEIRNEQRKIISSLPGKLKNQGMREVKMSTSFGRTQLFRDVVRLPGSCFHRRRRCCFYEHSINPVVGTY